MPDKLETIQKRLERFRSRREKLVKEIAKSDDDAKIERLEDSLAVLDQSIDSAEAGIAEINGDTKRTQEAQAESDWFI